MGTDGRGSTSPKNGVLDSSDGIITRAIVDLFKAKAARKNDADAVMIRMTYIEIYKDKVKHTGNNILACSFNLP